MRIAGSAGEPTSAPAAGSAKLPGVYRGALAAIAFGTTLAVSIVAVALFTIGRNGGEEAVRSDDRAGASVPGETDGAPSSTPVRIAISARHRGNLQLALEARVTAGGKLVRDAEVVAYTDMKTMPLAHGEGPLTMREKRDAPGVYRTVTDVPMVGDYEVRVQVRSPVRGEARKVVAVGTTEPGASDG